MEKCNIFDYDSVHNKESNNNRSNVKLENKRIEKTNYFLYYAKPDDRQRANHNKQNNIYKLHDYLSNNNKRNNLYIHIKNKKRSLFEKLLFQ